MNLLNKIAFASSGSRGYLSHVRLGISIAVCLLFVGGGFVGHVTNKNRVVVSAIREKANLRQPRDLELEFIDVLSREYKDSIMCLFGKERDTKVQIDVSRYLTHKAIQDWSKENLLEEWITLLNSSDQDVGSALQAAFLLGVAERRPGLLLEAIGEMGQSEGAINHSIANALWLARSSLFRDARSVDLLIGNPKLKSLYLHGALENAKTISEYSELVSVVRPKKGSAELGVICSIAERLIAEPESLAQRRDVVESLLEEPLSRDCPQVRYAILIASLRLDPYNPHTPLEDRLKNSSGGNGKIDTNLLDSFISGALEIDPQRGLSTICSLENPEIRSRALSSYVDKWLGEDPWAAGENLRNLSRVDDAKIVAARMVSYLERVGNAEELAGWRNYLYKMRKED